MMKRKYEISDYMKKIIYMLALVLVMGLCTGCGKESTELEIFPVEEPSCRAEKLDKYERRSNFIKYWFKRRKW